jgi:hypothetical protein
MQRVIRYVLLLMTVGLTTVPATAAAATPRSGHYGPVSTTVLSKCKGLCLLKFGVAKDRKHVIVSPKHPWETELGFRFAIQNRKAKCSHLPITDPDAEPYVPVVSIYGGSFEEKSPAGAYPAVGGNPAGSYAASKALPHWVKIKKGKWKLALSRTSSNEEGAVYKQTLTLKGRVKSSKKMTVTITASTQLLYPGELWEPPRPITDEDGNVIGTDPGSGPFAQTKCIAVPLKVTSKWRKPTSTGL